MSSIICYKNISLCMLYGVHMCTHTACFTCSSANAHVGCLLPLALVWLMLLWILDWLLFRLYILGDVSLFLRSCHTVLLWNLDITFFLKKKYNNHSDAKQDTQIFVVWECRLTRYETKSLGLRYEIHNFQVLASSAHPTITHKTLVFLYLKENPKLKSKIANHLPMFT